MNAIANAFSPTSGHAAAIGVDAHMSEVIDQFRANPGLRTLAVIDADGRPVGVIREQRVRELLFCLSCFSLMQNPTIGGSIAAMIEDCPTADVDRSTTALLRIAAGQIVLLGPQRARFRSDGGFTVDLARRDGPKAYPLCA